MRQRLLLVAGWAVAAVVSGLVSAGAVAVAGGQVTDRPLRPLTAAEVAALPVARTVEGPSSAGPLPPVVPAVELDSSTEGAPRSRPRSGDELDPAGDEGTLEGDGDVVLEPAAPTATPEDTERDVVRADPLATGDDGSGTSSTLVSPDPDRTVVLVSHTTGGSTSVTGRDGVILAFTARPRPGFAVSHDFEDRSALVVFFTGGAARWIVTAVWDDGDFVLTESVQRL